MSRDDLNWHHRWFPERNYRDSEGRKFRNWPCQLVLLVVHSHEMEHECLEPPTRPSPEYVQKVNRLHLEGACQHPFCAGRAIAFRDRKHRDPIDPATGRKHA